MYCYLVVDDGGGGCCALVGVRLDEVYGFVGGFELVLDG